MAGVDATADIDEALSVAVRNLSLLDDAVKMLKLLEVKAQQEGDRGAAAADRAFEELSTSLLARKEELLAELVEGINSRSASIAGTQEVVAEKQQLLASAVRVAKVLRASPSLRTCCDLPQVVNTLKMPVKAELSSVNRLKENLSPRFFLNADEVSSLFGSLGEIERGAAERDGAGWPSPVPGDREEAAGCRARALAQDVPPAPWRESDEEALGGIWRNASVKESFPALPPPSVPALPEAPSSSDDDDPEEFRPDYHAEEQQRRLFRKAELVFVTHVVHPRHFYVRRCSRKKEAKVLEKKLKNFCCGSPCLLPFDVLELGAGTFIKSGETGTWCRGTIAGLIPLQGEEKRKPPGPVRYRVCDTALLEAFLIDWGSSVVLRLPGSCAPADLAPVPTVKTEELGLFLRKPEEGVEAQLAAFPPLAVRCALRDVIPKQAGEGWGEAAKAAFVGMVKDKLVLMTVFGEEDGALTVDLGKRPFGGISDDTPASLQEALVCLGLARYTAGAAVRAEDTQWDHPGGLSGASGALTPADSGSFSSSMAEGGSRSHSKKEPRERARRRF